MLITAYCKNNTVLENLLLEVATIIGIFAIYLAFINIPRYFLFIFEDGIVENCSALFWFTACFVCCLTVVITPHRTYKNVIVRLCLAFMFLVCGGEEISWGQRLMGFEGPELLVSINKQNETNLHNIGSISIFSNLFFLATLIFFFVYPYILKKNKVVQYIVHQYKLPTVNKAVTHIFVLSLFVWIVIGVRFGTLGFSPLSLWGYYTQMDDEIFELLAAFSFLAFSLTDFENSVTRDRTDLHGKSL